MHFLVTRPQPESEDMQRRLESLGHQVSLAPLMRIEDCPAHLALEGVQALLVTSRNGVRALVRHAECTRLLALPVIAVGPGTATLARREGFSVALEGRGGGAELADLIIDHLDPERGALLHASGETVAFDLTAALAEPGFEVRRAIIYRSVAAHALPERVVQDLRDHRLDAVLLMSPKTAQVWTRLVGAAGLQAEAQGLIHLCLSPAVATGLDPLQVRTVRVAVQPNSEEMLALAEQLSSTSAR